MKIFIVALCIIIPLWAHTINKPNALMEVKKANLIEEAPVEIPTAIIPDIDPNDYRGPLQNLKSNIPEDALLKNEFNGISYEILTSTRKGTRDYETSDYVQAVEACAKSQPKPRTLLTFKSAEENAFVAKWLFDDLKIVTQVWIGLTRVNGTNDFVWTDGTKLTPKNKENVFRNWDKCEPNDITTSSWNVEGWGEDCVEMYSSYYPYPVRCDEVAKAGQWNDIPCRHIFNMVVCQGIA